MRRLSKIGYSSETMVSFTSILREFHYTSSLKLKFIKYSFKIFLKFLRIIQYVPFLVTY